MVWSLIKFDDNTKYPTGQYKREVLLAKLLRFVRFCAPSEQTTLGGLYTRLWFILWPLSLFRLMINPLSGEKELVIFLFPGIYYDIKKIYLKLSNLGLVIY